MTGEEYIRAVREVYDLVRVLSKRNGGEVLHLRHKTLHRDIVLRRLPKKIEAYRILRDIKSENLPEIFDVISCEDGQIVWEEYIDGLTVADIMEAGQRYRPRGAKRVMKGVCRALTVLHTHNLVHRDVKAENVMVTATGRVVLIDFGIAREHTEAPKDTAVMGTLGYAAPEQFGMAQSDARTDLYAAAVLFNILLTGKHPSECLAPGRAGRLIRKGTQMNPDDRVQTAEKMLKML